MNALPVDRGPALPGPTRDGAVKDYAPLVKRIVGSIRSRLPASVLFDDLYQDGMIGLMAAVEGFDPDQHVMFDSYAGTRIKGAILDGLRETDWFPRGIRKTQRDLNAAEQRLAQKNLRKPTETEMADEMDVTVAAFQQTLRDAMGAYMYYMGDMGYVGDQHRADKADFDMRDAGSGPEAALAQKRRNESMLEALKSLPDRHKRFMYLYYQCDWTFLQIADEFGVTESRGCQIHGEVVHHLRTHLQDWGALEPKVRKRLQKRTREVRVERKRVSELDT